jgi:molecular chaperone GrpE
MAEKHKHKHSGDGDSPAVETETAAESKNAEANASERFDGALPVEPANELQELRRQLADAQDRHLRGQAELENARKRMHREMEDERRYAELRLLEDLLPVIDNLERAIGAAEKNADAASLLSGIKMVSQQLTGVLERHHFTPIKAEGEMFDPAVHEAIMQQPSAEHPDNTVVGVGLPGYKLHDRVVRPAQVVVSKKSN